MLLSFAVFIVIYAACATSVYRGLSAGRPTLQNPHPEHITGFPAELAFITALLPALVAGVVFYFISFLVRAAHGKFTGKT
jgi:TRAP-type C4-dicarboxylate transport system permease small subunit